MLGRVTSPKCCDGNQKGCLARSITTESRSRVLGLLVRRVRIPSCNVESLLLLRNENGARKAFPYSVQLSVLGTTNHEHARDVRLHSKFKFENSAGRYGTSFAMSSSWREPGTPPPTR